jgi:hypothetical protein
MKPLYPKTAASPAQIKNPSDGLSEGFVVSEPEQIKLYALIADSAGASAYGLWAWARSIDHQGSGFVSVTIDQIRAKLGCSRATFYRWVGSGLFFWRWRNLGQGKFWIQYKSPHRVYRAQGVTDIGAIAMVPAIYLDRNARKSACTELEAMRLQAQAVHHAHRQERGRILDPERTARSKSSLFSRGSASTSRFIVLEPNAPIVPHGSISKVARRMGRSMSTIQRRLSDTWRSAQSLTPIARARTARKLSSAQIVSHRFNLDREQFVGLPEFHKPATYFVNPKSSSYQYVASIDGAPCFLGGNVYASDLEVDGFRRERKGIKGKITG